VKKICSFCNKLFVECQSSIFCFALHLHAVDTF